MARPRKWRKVCCIPNNNLFGPLNPSPMDQEPIIMSVEEYETIRLIDFEGLIQEECANRMKVARTTVQRIYNEARKKIATALVNGQIIKIKGGDYKLYSDEERNHGCRLCGKYMRRHSENSCRYDEYMKTKEEK